MSRLDQLEKQIARLRRRAVVLDQISRKYWNARRIIFICGVLLALAFCNFAGVRPAWYLAAFLVGVFGVVTYFHSKVRESLERNSLMIEIKQVQMSRIRLDWDKLPPADETQHPISGHPFETDLDITGERSLHRLLDCAVTKEGSERLKSWLLNARPDYELIRHRQSLVNELKGHSLFRDKLQLLSAVARVTTGSRKSHLWNSSILASWIERAEHKKSLLPAVLFLLALSTLNLVIIVLAFFELIPNIWPLSFLLYFSSMLLLQSRIATAWGDLYELEKTLTYFKVIFRYLESRNYKHTPGLAEICVPFVAQNKQPSTEIRRLGRLAAALGVRTNPLLWFIVHLLVPWDFIFSHRLQIVKEEIAHQLPRWLNAWYELEALNSFANFAYLNPHYTLPEISADADANQLVAQNLGHPLLRPEFKVCNNFAMDHEQRIVILTGSNMAGKSTFLRTIGVNLCLAYAGAPVNADRLHASLFRLFTCIKVSDSVQDGLSYFYAEVKRLQALLAAAKADDALPLLFLIDEIFRGTNSRERLIGSRSYIRALSQTSSVGLVATHDLELIKLADEIDGVENFHFREEVSDGRMVFDYRLRPGPCPTTNALTIMRLEGLPVDQ